MEDDDLLMGMMMNEFTVPEMQDSPGTFSKKIIKKLGTVYAAPLWVLMSSTLKQYN